MTGSPNGTHTKLIKYALHITSSGRTMERTDDVGEYLYASFSQELRKI